MWKDFVTKMHSIKVEALQDQKNIHAVCRRVRASFSPEILPAGAVMGQILRSHMQQGITPICNISQALVHVDKQLLMLLFCNLLFVQKIFIMFCTRLHREALGPPGDSRQEPRKCVGLCPIFLTICWFHCSQHRRSHPINAHCLDALSCSFFLLQFLCVQVLALHIYIFSCIKFHLLVHAYKCII